jgi:type IV pilus assembly protein PilE
MKKRRGERGFTLMELMVVIVIVAILAAVAVPLYINYVKDAQRTEAKGAIGAVITAQQTYFQVNSKYATTPSGGFIRNPTPGSQGGLNCDLTESLGNWKIESAATGTGGADGYTVTATHKTDGTLYVQYTYSRTSPPTNPWNETPPPGP